MINQNQSQSQIKLSEIIAYLQKWDKAHADNATHRCLESVRWACGQCNLQLPPPTAENTAYANFELMQAAPAKYGWKQIHTPLPRYSLVYFGGCGKLADGRIAGHIAILDSQEKKIFANETYSFTEGWSAKLKGAFVPV